MGTTLEVVTSMGTDIGRDLEANMVLGMESELAVVVLGMTTHHGMSSASSYPPPLILQPVDVLQALAKAVFDGAD